MTELIEGYMPQHYKIVKYMRSVLRRYSIYRKGKVVNAEHLAEMACAKFELWGYGYNSLIPYWIIELACKVGAEYEEKEREKCSQV